MKIVAQLFALMSFMAVVSSASAEIYTGDFQCNSQHKHPNGYVRKGDIVLSGFQVHGSGEWVRSAMTCEGNFCYSVGGSPDTFQYSTMIEIFKNDEGLISVVNTFIVYPVMHETDDGIKILDRGGVTVNVESWDCSW